MSLPLCISAEPVAAVLELHLAITAVERDRLAGECHRLTHECDRLAHERDAYKSRAEWLEKQLERLKDEAKTPREHVDLRAIQLVFAPFAEALFGTAATSGPETEVGSSDDGEKKPKKKRKTTPHGRRTLPETLPVETIVLTPSPLPENATPIGAEISWRLGYRRAAYYRLRVVRPIFVVPKEAAERITDVDATHVEGAGPVPGVAGGGVSAPTGAPSSEPVAASPVVQAAHEETSTPTVSPSSEPVAGAPVAAAPQQEASRPSASIASEPVAAAPLAATSQEEASAPVAMPSSAPIAPGRTAATPLEDASMPKASTRTPIAPNPGVPPPGALSPETIADDLPNKTIVYAPAPDEMIPRGLPTVDLLAHVLVGKFADKLPFNRQEGIGTREGVPITRGTMCGWAQAAHELAHLVVDAMEADGRQHADVIATDATGVLVQANEKCKKGHFWVYVADRDHVIFRYSSSASNDEPKDFFRGFHGIVLSDASNVYDVLFGLPESPGEANCWSHARRYFYKAIESENRAEALVGVGFCNALFAIERECKPLSPSERLEVRQKRSAPVVESLKRWKDDQLARPQVAEGSLLRKALNYMTNQWNGLGTFLKDGRVPIDNNESERQLRSLVVGRANWLFVGGDDTAAWTCTFVSLVASCQLQRIDPEGYLRDLFRVLPVWPQTRMLELAPKYWRATRALLQDAQLALPLGPLTVPPARPLRDPVAAPERAPEE